MNAIKHGLTARDVVLPGENPDEFESFRADILAGLAPQGLVEGALAEMIVGSFWRLRRVPKVEALLYEYVSTKLLVKRAEESVQQYESTEKDRVLASLERRKVVARDRRPMKMPSRNLRASGLISTIPPSTWRVRWRAHPNRFEISGGTKLRLPDPC